MKNRIYQKLFPFSFAILAGNGLLGYAIYKSNQKLRDSELWVQHTEQVITRSASIGSIAGDIETASRGFVITDDNTFLEPFYSAKKTVLVYIEQLRQLTRDNPVQQQRIDSLTFYMNKHLNFSYQTISIRGKEGLISAVAYISTKQGKHYTDRIRQITKAIEQEEEALLKQRKQTNEDSAAVFDRFTVIMFILMSGFTIVLLIAIGKYWIQNKEKELRADELIIANKELVFQNEEKEKRAGELIKTAAQLESANQELESFSYSVSHDLRAPLRAVNGYAKILEEDYGDRLDDEGRRLLTVVQNNAKKMGVLIDDLLTFSRLGRKEIKKSVINMTALVENVLAELHTSQQFKTVVTISDLHPAIADTTLMNQVWENLLSNAIKYSSNNKSPDIKISSEKKNDELIYSISDNGVGFDMKHVHKLFGVFQRLHSSKDFEGTGVGLALVHRIITKQGGRIWAKAGINKGATFYFSLPEKELN
jgi:signal transduction histidine kinase